MTALGLRIALVSASGVLLPSGKGAFAPALAGRLLLLSLTALAGLVPLHWAGLALRLLPEPRPAGA